MSSSSDKYLGVLDYTIIVSGLTLSAIYGLYHGMRNRKTESDLPGTTFEYLLASRSVGWLPIAISYFASLTSSGTLIGYPVEVYSFGLQMILLASAILPSVIVFNEIFLPIYYRLKSGSLYEYLELRFNSKIKKLITIIGVFQTVILSSANIYGPATVLSQVTGITTWYIVVTLSLLCIIYTTFGGIRAVIWADVVQALLMFISMGLLLGFGIYYIGDINLIYSRNLDTGRLNVFKFEFNLHERSTFWNTTIGYFFSFLSLSATSQFLVQRLMTAPNITMAKRANILGNLLFMLSMFITHTIGLVIYATFHGCDPLMNGLIENINQLVPAYLMKIFSSYIMLPGIIFTGLLCACLSTLSSVYNSTAMVLFNLFPQMSDKKATLLCKILVFIVGVFSTLGVALAELFPNIIQSVLSIYAAVSAPLLGMLLIGVFCPQASIKVTFVSFMCSVIILFYAIAGTLIEKQTLVMKSLSMELCEKSLNDTVWNITSTTEDYNIINNSIELNNDSLTDQSSAWSVYFPLSSMSYLWYSSVGTLSTICIFIVLSLFIGKETSQPVAMDIIPEVVQNIHRKLPQNIRKILLCDVYSDEVQKALKPDSIIVKF